MKKNKIFIAASILSIVGVGEAMAYESKDDALVAKERQSEEYVRKGIRTGSFLVLPKVEMTNQYDSNIYKRDRRVDANAEIDSYVAHFKPGVEVRSDWSRHALNLMFDSDLPLYARQGTNNNYEDLKTSVNGRLDVVGSNHFDTGFAYDSLHEDRGSPDQKTGVTPTFYDTKTMNGSYSHKLNRVTFKGGVGAVRYDYQDVQTSFTGTSLLMSTRNHWEYAPSVRIGYEIQPEYEAFVNFVYKEADYDKSTLSSGAGTAINRNSSGYNVLGGLAFDLTDLVTGDMSVGYLKRNYVAGNLPDISGINGFVNLKWRPTALTTVNGRFSHDIQETTQEGVAGILASGINLSADHELMRNVILSAGGSFTNNDYRGFIAPNTENRNDKVYGGNVAAKYLLNRNLSTDLSYNYQSRDVNYVFSNYEVHQVMLNLRGQF